MPDPPEPPLWTPAPERVARANLTAFAESRRRATGRDRPAYRALHAWSVARPEEFWPAVWRFCGLVATERPGREPWDAVGVGLERMAPPDPVTGPWWFPGARLSFAENLLRYRDDRPALVAWNETGRRGELSYPALSHATARVAAALPP